MNRGDIVIVDFRSVNPSAGVRPALVAQNNRDNARMGNTILVQVSTNTTRAGEDTQVLLAPTHPDWNATGLKRPSVINCSNVYTVEQRDIVRVIGSLTAATMRIVDGCLKVSLGIA